MTYQFNRRSLTLHTHTYTCTVTTAKWWKEHFLSDEIYTMKKLVKIVELVSKYYDDYRPVSQWKHHRSWHGIWLVKSCCQYCVSINRVTTFQALWNCPRFPPLGTENDLYRTGDAHVPNVTRSCILQSVIMRSFADEFFQPVFHLHSYWQLNKKIQKSSNHHSWDDLYREKERPNGTL